ncbi:hypothetical protein [Desulfocurvus sp. DL9XJH121]
MPRKSGKAREDKEPVEEIRDEALMDIPNLDALRAEVLDQVRGMRRDLEETLAGMSGQWAGWLRDMRREFKSLDRGGEGRAGRGARIVRQDSGPREEFPDESGPDYGPGRDREEYEEACLAAQRQVHEAMLAALECVSGGEDPEPDRAVEEAMQQSLDEGLKVVQSLSALGGGGFAGEEEDGRDPMEQADAALRNVYGGPPDDDS